MELVDLMIDMAEGEGDFFPNAIDLIKSKEKNYLVKKNV